MAKRSIYFPKPKKLLASLRLRSREYLRENTLHGFPYFVNSRRPLWERIVWFILTMSSIAAAIGIMWTIYETFQAEPTLTGLDTETEELQTHFPSVALCPIRPAFHLDPNLTAEEAKYYSFIYNWFMEPITLKLHNSLMDDTEYSLFFYSYFPECGLLFRDCAIGRTPIDCQEFFQKRITVLGICCVTEAIPISKEKGVRQIAFTTVSYLAYPFSMFLLDIDERPAHRDGQVGYVVRTGVILKISIQVTTSSPGVFSLPRKQRRCNTQDEGRYSTCIHKCHQKQVLKKYGCLPWYLIIGSGTTECKLPQYDLMAQNTTLSDCKCYLGCNQTVYTVDSVQLSKDSRDISISIPNWPAVTYRREIRFSWLDILASFGGIAGLFVGYSLLTSVELLYYLFLRTYCGAVIEGPADAARIEVKKKRPQRIKVIKVIDMKKDYHSYVE